MLSRVVEIYGTDGAGGLARAALCFAYKRSIRPFMPITDRIVFNGVTTPFVRTRRGDIALSRFRPQKVRQDEPLYESALRQALRRHVGPGDRVLVVGGGVGVTAVIAAQATGRSGHVTCYEGSIANARQVAATLRLNNVFNTTVVTKVVGENVGVYGKDASKTTLAAEHLPPCNLLELDCEGAEIAILDRMTIRPRTIAVETHGHLKAPSDAVRRRLETLGYDDVEDLGWAEPTEDLSLFCEEHDIRVLVATSGKGPTDQGGELS